MVRTYRFSLVAVLTIILSIPVFGQEYRRYEQKTELLEFDNYRYDIVGRDSNSVRNQISAAMLRPGCEIADVQFSPDGAYYAILLKRGTKQDVRLYDYFAAYYRNKYMAELKHRGFVPTAMCFTPSGKYILVADDKGILHSYDLTSKKLNRGRWKDSKIKLQSNEVMTLGFKASRIVVSSDERYVAAASDHEIIVFSWSNHNQIRAIYSDAPIVAVGFPQDNSYLAVLASDGSMSLYDTQNFAFKTSVNALGMARQMAIHPNSKYIAVVTSDNAVAVVNTMDIEDRQYVFDDEGGINDVCFVADNSTWLGYNTSGSFVFREMSELNPNFRQLLNDELADRMEEWLKRMPDETLEEYNLRVSEENRALQISLFEEEIATRLAENKLYSEQITLGGYNYNEGILAIEVASMPSIYLNVPEDELYNFASAEQLEFRNARYALTEADHFELVYVDVVNKVTGATYTYSNRERKSLEYLTLDDSYVPLDLIQLSNMQELTLENIRNDVMTDAQSKNVKLEHTNIAVTTKVVPGTDGSGNRIMNYRVGFSYDVDNQFSAVEDFAAGKYRISESGAASSMVEIIAQAFKGEFARYIKEGGKVKIAITGMADNLKINRAIPYDGCYGEFTAESVHSAEGMRNITVTSANGISQNDQLAFVRAAGVKDYIARNISEFRDMDTEYEYHIELADEAGGAFRRITVTFTFIDAF